MQPNNFSNPLVPLAWSIAFLLVGIIFLAIVAYPKSSTGTLYMIDSPDSVCHGTLKSMTVYTTEYKFLCDDGRLFEHLTNFRLDKDL